MISYKTHQGLTDPGGGVTLVLPGDNTRVSLVIMNDGLATQWVRLTDTNLPVDLVYIKQSIDTSVLLFRDYGPLIQQQLFISFSSTSDEFTVNELLDSSFRNI